jgi:hypothetical protein
MEVGALYKVQYKSEGGNYRWSLREMTAVYLGYNPKRQEHTFSLRPLMGSTSLSKRSPITSVEMLMSAAQVNKLHFGLRDKSLPVKVSRRIGPADKPVGY